MEYAEYLQTPEWRSKRQWALERAGNRCQVCNCTGEMHVHHRTYENLGHEQPGDLTVLCRACHGLYHEKVSVSLSPEAVCDLIRGARQSVMFGPTVRRKRSMVEPEQPTTEQYIRRTALALSAFPENLRPIVAGAILETQLVPAEAVADLLSGLAIDEVEAREVARFRERVRSMGDQLRQGRRTPA